MDDAQNTATAFSMYGYRLAVPVHSPFSKARRPNLRMYDMPIAMMAQATSQMDKNRLVADFPACRFCHCLDHSDWCPSLHRLLDMERDHRRVCHLIASEPVATL